jgi:hypothetical protein
MNLMIDCPAALLLALVVVGRRRVVVVIRIFFAAARLLVELFSGAADLFRFILFITDS